ncbi:MAG: hypothetical protein ABI645_02280 [Pseudomonadota bacterium]
MHAFWGGRALVIVALMGAHAAVAQQPPPSTGGGEEPARGGISGIYEPGVKDAKAHPAQPRSPRDFAGVFVKYRPQQPIPEPAYTPAAAAEAKKFDVNLDPAASCLVGWPRNLTAPYPLEIVQTENFTLQWFESWPHTRRIWTDGRKIDLDKDLTYYGEAIGHWEGNTFVVVTTNLIAQTLDNKGATVGPESKVTERWDMIEGGRAMRFAVTVEDPTRYTKPRNYTLTFDRTNDELLEYMCQQNNRNDPARGNAEGNILAAPGTIGNASPGFFFESKPNGNESMPRRDGAKNSAPANDVAPKQ